MFEKMVVVHDQICYKFAEIVVYKYFYIAIPCEIAWLVYVTGFWKISLNVTFYNSNIYNQNKEWELPINLKVVTMCSSHLELPENNWKYFEKFCNPFAVVTINCVFQCDIKTDFPKSGHIYAIN